ncbi:hypothetical protein E3P99_03574 [Wallemia hederae]|uniref:Uncharacterized protein n=1 Tax=Wallemia hederae TaxID=1540922 RepID=A0A4T0FF04_9BASI|nr:hypothetical protein E3P99_03574 [Wallemia hederae]
MTAEIDLDELQAQISLSMGTISDMTSSWQKPSHKASAAPKHDDLSEWMSRPSRLGLGAAPAQTSVSTVDPKLQRKLTQKKPGDGGDTKKTDAENDDEEESKYTTTSAAKKNKSSAKSYLDKPHAAKKAIVGVDTNVQLSKKQRKKLNKKLKQQQQQQQNDA